MPISYRYDPENRLLECQVGTKLFIGELVEYLRAVQKDDAIKEGSIEIVSLDQVSEFAIRAQEVQDAEPELRSHLTRGDILATIFVGPQPLQTGIANMLSGLLATMFPEYPAPVVRGRDEALEEFESIRSGMREAADIERETP